MNRFVDLCVTQGCILFSIKTKRKGFDTEYTLKEEPIENKRLSFFYKI